jgi:hypothetical protein
MIRELSASGSALRPHSRRRIFGGSGRRRRGRAFSAPLFQLAWDIGFRAAAAADKLDKFKLTKRPIGLFSVSEGGHGDGRHADVREGRLSDARIPLKSARPDSTDSLGPANLRQ